MKLKSLLICYKQLGDTLLTEPALDALARATGESVGLIARPGFRDLASLMGSYVRFVHPSLSLVAERIFCADAGSRCAARALICRGPREVIVEREQQIRFIHRLGRFRIVHVPMEQEYRARWLWRGVTQSTEGDLSFRPPRLSLPPETWRMDETLSDLETGYTVLHVGSAWRRKCWSVERWVEVIKQWPSAYGPLILSSGPSDWEQEIAVAIEGQAPEGSVLRAGRMDFRSFCWMLAHSARVVAVDGAAAHLARAFDVPVLTLFGETDPAQWHWPSPRSRMLQAPDHTMKSIRPKEVFQELEQIPVNRT